VDLLQLGAGRLAASTFLKDLNAGKFDAAPPELVRWDHAGAQELAGLKAGARPSFSSGTAVIPRKGQSHSWLMVTPCQSIYFFSSQQECTTP